MRLFLSSQDLGSYGHLARKMAGSNGKAAFFKNAQDDLAEDVRNATLPEKQQMFEEAGFEFEHLDLRDYFGRKYDLEQKLNEFGSVWFAGGNTFILRRAMRASGIDDILIDWLKQDKIMYGGYSAGACITSTSLDGIQYGDRPKPEDVPDSYPIKDTIWEGLGLIDFMIIPHCNMEWFIDQARETEIYLKEKSIPYAKLNDGQVVVVDGELRATFL